MQVNLEGLNKIREQISISVLESESQILDRCRRIADSIVEQYESGCGYSLGEKFGLFYCLGEPKSEYFIY